MHKLQYQISQEASPASGPPVIFEERKAFAPRLPIEVDLETDFRDSDIDERESRPAAKVTTALPRPTAAVPFQVMLPMTPGPTPEKLMGMMNTPVTPKVAGDRRYSLRKSLFKKEPARCSEEIAAGHRCSTKAVNAKESRTSLQKTTKLPAGALWTVDQSPSVSPKNKGSPAKDGSAKHVRMKLRDCL